MSSAPATLGPAAAMEESGRTAPPRRRGRRNWVPYLLLAPGLLWLLVFYVAPMVTLGSQSMQEGNVDDGYVFTGNVGIFVDAVSRYWPQLLRSLGYAASATVLALAAGQLSEEDLADWFREHLTPDLRQGRHPPVLPRQSAPSSTIAWRPLGIPGIPGHNR